MKQLDFSQLSHVLSRFLHRYHVTLFVVLTVGGLSLVALFLNQAVAGQSTDTSIPADPPFDQTTMTRIVKLRTTSDRSDLQLPAGRTNPFR